MTNKEIDIYLKKLEKFEKEVTSSPEKSFKFLIDVGILNEDGSYSENYFDLNKNVNTI